MVIVLEIFGSLSLAAWIYLFVFHGRFWQADQFLSQKESALASWPSVIAVVPARNEADVINQSLSSLLNQDYPGSFSIILVDDHSEDGTSDVAISCGQKHPKGTELRIIRSDPLPSGWVGKMWAVNTGVTDALRQEPEYLWLTDADIQHQPQVLRDLVQKAEQQKLTLVSLMVMLHCKGLWERLLIPAFVFFFQKLYPFPQVNNPQSQISGAAGGCMLVRRTALEAAGGIASIKSEIIDDCALGQRLKKQGAIWLGLTTQSFSIRPYEGIHGVWKMVARSAFTQLHYSSLLLIGTLFGLAILYIAPPALIFSYPWHSNFNAAALGVGAWLLMAIAYIPTLRLYSQSFWQAVFLPVAGILYALMTFDSALRYWRGKGGQWKGRSQAQTTR